MDRGGDRRQRRESGLGRGVFEISAGFFNVANGAKAVPAAGYGIGA
jgi:hypothetical protein